MQVVSSGRSRELARKNWLRPEAVPGPRGRILDRDGKILADMVPSFSIVFDPHTPALAGHRARLDSTLARLAALTGADVERYRRIVRNEGGASYLPVRLRRNADSVAVARVEEHRSILPGVSVQVEPMRYYPHDSLAAHVLGYVNEVGSEELRKLSRRGYRPGSLIGRTGVERQYEEQLRGEDGVRYIEVNALGRRSEAFVRAESIPARPGRDVILTLDGRLQGVMERSLDAAGYDGRTPPDEVEGAAVLMDVRTGEILAMASRPGFDPNVFSTALSQQEWNRLIRPSAPLMDRVIQAAYPPGSVFKPLTLYEALAEGDIRPGQKLAACTGAYRFGNRVFHCWKWAGHGTLTTTEALAQSCDVFFYQLATPLGVEGIARAGELFRVAERTGVDLPRERAGLVPDKGYYDRRFGKRGWSRGVALNLVIGQGEVLLTPIELVRYVGVLATSGIQVTPRVLKGLGEERRRQRHRVPPGPVPPRRIPLDPAAIAEVRRGMVQAVREGTARGVALPGVTVAAKTGTAQNPGKDHALFVAYAPAEDPQVAIAVVLENRGHGGSVAAPVAKRVLAAYFGIPDSIAVPVRETD